MILSIWFTNIFLSASLPNNHYLATCNSHQPKIHHVHARLSTNSVEGSRNIEDGITTRVSISHTPLPQKPIINILPDPGSPPFADATDTDENSEECEEKIHGSITSLQPRNHCSNQAKKRYCSVECFKASELNTRYI
jgi:hypothetical protein